MYGVQFHLQQTVEMLAENIVPETGQIDSTQSLLWTTLIIIAAYH